MLPLLPNKRLFFCARRSSDGKWEQKGEPIGPLHSNPVSRRDDMWVKTFIVGPFAVGFAGVLPKNHPGSCVPWRGRGGKIGRCIHCHRKAK